MWRKFRDDTARQEARPGITIAEVFSPMLEPTSFEATISECSLEVKPSSIFTQKLKERLLSCCKLFKEVFIGFHPSVELTNFWLILGYIMLIMFIPIIVFVLVLEWRRLMLTDVHLPLIANGTLHLAQTSCGPVQG